MPQKLAKNGVSLNSTLTAKAENWQNSHYKYKG